VTVRGGRKLGVIKSTATGIEVDIDGLGRGGAPPGSAASTDALQPPWLREMQLPEPGQRTKADLSKPYEPTEQKEVTDIFSANPQGRFTCIASLSVYLFFIL